MAACYTNCSKVSLCSLSQVLPEVVAKKALLKHWYWMIISLNTKSLKKKICGWMCFIKHKKCWLQLKAYFKINLQYVETVFMFWHFKGNSFYYYIRNFTQKGCKQFEIRKFISFKIKIMMARIPFALAIAEMRVIRGLSHLCVISIDFKTTPVFSVKIICAVFTSTGIEFIKAY